MKTSSDQARVPRGQESRPTAGARPILPRADTPPVISVASGKGGVGKTFVAINLALALREVGYQPLLLDLDWGLGNVDVALGLAARLHAGHLLAGQCTISEVLMDFEGLPILPNGCGDKSLSQLAPNQIERLLNMVRESENPPDLIITDTHPGIGALTLGAIAQSDLTLVISSPEPTALTDTYALFKVLGGTPQRDRIALIINEAATAEQAYESSRHLDTVARRFLGREIPYWGHILLESAVARSVRDQQPLLTTARRSSAANSIRELAIAAARFVLMPKKPGTA